MIIDFSEQVVADEVITFPEWTENAPPLVQIGENVVILGGSAGASASVGGTADQSEGR